LEHLSKRTIDLLSLIFSCWILSIWYFLSLAIDLMSVNYIIKSMIISITGILLMYKLYPFNKKYEQFNNWCKTEEAITGTPENTLDINSLIRSNKQPSIDQVNDFISDHINRQNIQHINISTQQYNPATKKEVVINKSNEIIHFDTVNILLQNKLKLIIKNSVIRSVTLDFINNNIHPPVEFINCEIGEIKLNRESRIILNETKIGLMTLNNVHSIYMTNGCILNFSCPVPSQANPFTGSIIFSNTFFPKNSKNYLLENAQPYRNMRHHLRSIENGQMANIFHSAELSVEREDDTNANKFISTLYQLFSNYGSSAIRPFAWWICIMLLVTTIIFLNNGAVPTQKENTQMGWKSELVKDSDSISSRLKKASYLSMQNMLNPLGILGVKTFMTPKYSWLAFLLAIQGLFSAVLIALMIFAIRRRFKID